MSENQSIDLPAAATRAQASAVVPGTPSNERTENMTWGGSRFCSCKRRNYVNCWSVVQA